MSKNITENTRMIMKFLLICLFLAVKISFTITSSMHMHFCSCAMQFREKQRFLTWTNSLLRLIEAQLVTFFLNVFDFDKSENSKWRSTRYGRSASLDEFQWKIRKFSSKFNAKGNVFQYFAYMCRLLFTFSKFSKKWVALRCLNFDLYLLNFGVIFFPKRGLFRLSFVRIL